MADTNSTSGLDYLIPIGPHDIAVREILVPIFGDAIACKVPGLACGDASVHTGGALLSSIFTVFNGGTAIFATILLLFIGLFGFTRTAMDGEFLGRTWNTTYTAMRLAAGIAFLLPMPNGYSSIQNFALYVGLWSSGLGNQVNVALSDHYLKRVQTSMVMREPSATTLTPELRQILAMNICAEFLNRHYPMGSGERYSLLQPKLTEYHLGSSGPSAKAEIAFLENGTYHPAGSAPCGSMQIERLTPAYTSTTVPNNAWDAAYSSDALTGSARNAMAKTAYELSYKIRAAKTNLLSPNLMEPSSSPVGLLARDIVSAYISTLHTYNEDGSIASAGSSEVFNTVKGAQIIDSWVNIERTMQERLLLAVNEATQDLYAASQSTGSDSFFTNAKNMLQNGGWMATAAVHRTMLDMVSLKFDGPNESPYSFVAPTAEELALYSSKGADAMNVHIGNINTAINNLLQSDYAKEKIKATLQSESGTISTKINPQIDESTFKDIAKSGNPESAMKALYGSTMGESARTSIIKSMSLSADVDPLFQIKNIGDMLVNFAENILTIEMTARVAILTSGTASGFLTGNIVGKVTGAETGTERLIDGAKYVLEGIFTFSKAVMMAFLAIGFALSTWIPSLPFIAFMMAQLGWLFGVIMTLFALNIWAVMHLTPARNDSFIGSEQQGYLLLVALFFRPAIAVSALGIAFVVAGPVVKLVNMTLIPMMYISNVSSNTQSIVISTIFCLFLYFIVLKGVLVMVYSIPQSFPDEVMRIISAGIGDLGQSKSQSEMGASVGGTAAAIQTANNVDRAGSQHFRATLNKQKEKAAEAAADAGEKANAVGSGDSSSQVSGAGDTGNSRHQKPDAF